MAGGLNGRYQDVESFIENYQLGHAERDKLADWLRSHGVEIESEAFEKDWSHIANQVTREIAGLLWDRQAYYRVWLEGDNQVRQAITLFGQAQELAARR